MIEYFFSLIGNIISISSFNLANDQAKSEVISSLRMALRLTESHINNTRVGEFGGEEFTDKDSSELVAAWSRVAQATRPFDSGLARIFEDKSDYWTNPSGFHRDIIDGRRIFNGAIRIQSINEELNRIESRGL
jgi:hypothetical protein